MTKNTPPTPQQQSFRQFLSFPLIILLYTAAVPFSPISWLVGGLEGAYLFDRFVAGLLLLCACYFQWKISTLTYPTIITLPNPFAQSDTNYIRNGNVGARPSASTFEFVYRPSDYFLYTGVEIAILLVAEFSGFELLRRLLVIGVLGALWGVGWTITPRSTKQWAWSHIKAFWFFIVLDLIRDIGFGGGRRRVRR
ncbi:hypothetical protein DM02DRAFT_612802 [Periconia macrospinosa]|uniref:Uncharacterized protein n=1 Tax=Periconia macrospinosa TaxID=97972 RepID=A0A2V1DW26_9PLEO|nr:hypothetical protein DM02DRAFT_612802 [Periconia macrospinosa]